ncbi:Slp family lipoprotein [Alteromonas sediminis]|uniref:Slp family lipoprotein n=1 Tax=Alteromonas sediminis TaxID=2259342 RepID=A0A3N5XWA3_9ALTE|nr:Slp family lipoprotein [Alteromonas sediminis]RPJ65077.1 Slp family lipoprotein [Alteromonas sediminis]
MRHLLFIAVIFASGCAIVPENIKVADETALVSYEQVVSTGDTALTKPARWGGIIAGVENKQGSSEVEVVHFPLNGYGKPAVANESAGRFKVKMKGFLDPVVFEQGRTITFTGTVEAPTKGMIGEQDYVFPTLQGNSYHLWKKETVYDVSSIHYNYSSGWYSPFWYSTFPHRSRWGVTNSRIRMVERAPESNPKSGSTQQQQTRKSDSKPPNTINKSQ